MENKIYEVYGDFIIIEGKKYFWYMRDKNIGDVIQAHYPMGISPYKCYDKQLIGKTTDGRLVYKVFFKALHTEDIITRIIVIKSLKEM